MSEKVESATYTHGHHESVLRSHRWRTALNSAAYILPYLKPNMKVLDIGCGPGTITVDLAGYVPGGHVTGLDRAEDIVTQARLLAKDRLVDNVDFAQGDANNLDYTDESFDVVLCHQVLQHVGDPVGILREMMRVTKPGGVVAARESDYGGFVWYPDVEGMDDWRSLYNKVAQTNGGDPNAGRRLLSWAIKAGFPAGKIKSSSSTWCYSTDEEIAWWSSLWADRTVASAFAETARNANLATNVDLQRIADIWHNWGRQEDAWFSVLHGEIIYHKGS
jgi:SAM-dependent methyltransferase